MSGAQQSLVVASQPRSIRPHASRREPARAHISAIRLSPTMFATARQIGDLPATAL
jgi:hypothetical protein